MALMREVAVEIIAAKIAHPTNKDIQGEFVCTMVSINTLPPVGILSCKLFARQPKNTGIEHKMDINTAVKIEALEIVFDD